MAKEYTRGLFLRQTPKDALKAYFAFRGLLPTLAVDFSKMKKRGIEPLVAAIDALPKDKKDQIDRDFQAIFALADREGTQIILEVARFAGHDITSTIAKMENGYERAMWWFLAHTSPGDDLFVRALTMAEIKNMSFTRSRRRKGLPKQDPRTDDASRAEFAAAVGALYQKEGRGERCIVEYYPRWDPTRHCFFAYTDDYATSDMELTPAPSDPSKLTLDRRPRKSVFQIAFVYRPEEGVLELDAPGAAHTTEKLHLIFCQKGLGLPGLPAAATDQCYNLEVLKSPGFEFETEPADQIESVRVVALRLDKKGGGGRRIVVERPAGGAASFYDWLNGVVNTAKFPLDEFLVSQAKLKVTWKLQPGQRKQRTLSVLVTRPDSTNLKDPPHHNVIKRYLPKWFPT